MTRDDRDDLGWLAMIDMIDGRVYLGMTRVDQGKLGMTSDYW